MGVRNKFEILMSVQEEMGPEELAAQAQSILISAAKDIIPKRKYAKKKWMTTETLELIEKRRNIKVTKTAQSTEYKEISKAIKRSIRHDKKSYVENTCFKIEKLDEQHRDAQVYQHVKALTKEFKPSLSVIKDQDGNIHTEKEDIRVIWREYCKKMYNTQTSDNEETVIFETEPEPLMEEVKRAIEKLKNGKSPGCDDITAEMIREGGEESVKIYHQICCKIWKTGIWPKTWKRSIYIPIPKKGDLTLCTNYRTVALISHASKILLNIIQQRIQRKMKEEISNVQAGFQQHRGTRDHIFNLRNIIEKCREYNIDLYASFIDYSKAFDCVQHNILWKIMKEMNFPTHLTSLIENLYKDQQAAVRVDGELTDWFDVNIGVRQGCILSPYLFNIYAENIMRKVHEDPNYDNYNSLTIGGHDYPELRYADDTVLLSTTAGGIENMIMSVKTYSEEQNLYLNAKKTKIMKTDTTLTVPNITVGNDTIENVEHFEYLGSMITANGDNSKEVKRRLAMALQKVQQMRSLWNGTNRNTKVRLLRTCIFPIATYGSETWTINNSTEKYINAFELKCYRKILKISWTEKRTNKSVLEELKISENWLLNNIKSRKLKYFGHVKRHDSIEKIILEGVVPGKRRRGRPKRRWSQDITEQLGVDVTEAGRLAQDRSAFRSAVMRATSRQGHAT